jgi:hypothetical protein
VDYLGSYSPKSENVEAGDKIREAIGKLKDSVDKLNVNIEELTSIAGGTGLNLSLPTIRNLRSIQSGDDRVEKINPNGLAASAFKEVLGVDDELAYRLHVHFRWSRNEELSEISGITEELIQKIKDAFII